MATRRSRSQGARWGVIALAVVLLVALAVAGVLAVGCRKRETPAVQQPSVSVPATETTQPAVSEEPSESIEPTADASGDVVDVGPLHVPQPGTAERQQLADAARAKLGTASRFIVNQMWSDNAWAIAQLTPKDGGASKFVAYRHEPKGWVAIWTGPVPGDGTAAIMKADGRFESEVPAAIRWKGVSSSQTTSPSRPSNSDAIAAAKSFAKGSGGGDITITGAELLGMAKDSKGQWWAWVLVKGPANVDPLTVYEYKTGGSWKLWDLGTEPKPVPSDVKF